MSNRLVCHKLWMDNVSQSSVLPAFIYVWVYMCMLLGMVKNITDRNKKWNGYWTKRSRFNAFISANCICAPAHISARTTSHTYINAPLLQIYEQRYNGWSTSDVTYKCMDVTSVPDMPLTRGFSWFKQSLRLDWLELQQ
jgi:hypothetical protein